LFIDNAVTTEKAWQRLIRERKEKEYRTSPIVYADIKTSVCKRITYKEAESIILEYEWLGRMGQGTYCYGIYFDNILAGAVCFGLPASITAGDMFGIENRSKAICLERGACVWWAHEHSASKLISYAVTDMSRTTKYRIFFAYSDEDAGEIGTVYQACNWLYLGKMASGGSQNKLIDPDGNLKDSRHIMTYAKRYEDVVPNRTQARIILHNNGWSSKKTKPKCKYVIVKATSKKEYKDIFGKLCVPVYPYPKRSVA
jgi:hypothetical protein